MEQIGAMHGTDRTRRISGQQMGSGFLRGLGFRGTVRLFRFAPSVTAAARTLRGSAGELVELLDRRPYWARTERRVSRHNHPVNHPHKVRIDPAKYPAEGLWFDKKGLLDELTWS